MGKYKEEILFYSVLSKFIDAGVPLSQALEILAGDFIRDKEFARKVGSVKLQLEAGSSFADALKKLDFPLFIVKIVEAGETGGILDSILERYADFLKEKAELESFVKRGFWEFCRKFSILLSVGVPILEALDILSKEDFSFPRANHLAFPLKTVKNEVEAGKSLAKSFEKASFHTTFVTIVEIGESSGALDIMLQKYADILKLTAQIRLYPDV